MQEQVEVSADRPRTARVGTAAGVNATSATDASGKAITATQGQATARPPTSSGLAPVVKERPQPLTGTYTALSEVHLLVSSSLNVA